jgi:hypothetical protein
MTTMKTPQYPTTEEAKDLIQWFFSTETQYDETIEAGQRRNEVTKALLNWAKKPVDTKRYVGLRSGNTSATLSEDAKKLKLALKQQTTN